jgi:hypothetical protein
MYFLKIHMTRFHMSVVHDLQLVLKYSPLSGLYSFIAAVDYLHHSFASTQADPDNVVAVHCKAGKGRTGLVLVSYLMYCGLKSTAAEALEFYGWSRTTDGKGVTITSQIRYAHYFEEQLRRIKHVQDTVKAEQNLAPAVLIHRVRMHTIPHFNSDGGCSPALTIEVKSEVDHETYSIFQSSSVSPARAAASPRDASMRSRGSFEKMRMIGSMDGMVSLDSIDVPAEPVPGVGTRVAGDVKVRKFVTLLVQ